MCVHDVWIDLTAFSTTTSLRCSRFDRFC